MSGSAWRRKWARRSRARPCDSLTLIFAVRGCLWVQERQDLLFDGKCHERVRYWVVVPWMIYVVPPHIVIDLQLKHREILGVHVHQVDIGNIFLPKKVHE